VPEVLITATPTELESRQISSGSTLAFHLIAGSGGGDVATHYAGFVSTTAQNSVRTNPEAAENQPLMATGADLKGPPQRFPAV